MNMQSRDLESDVIDLTDCSLAELRACGIESLEPALDRLLRQVYRPRSNYGGTGEPGRAD